MAVRACQIAVCRVRDLGSIDLCGDRCSRRKMHGSGIPVTAQAELLFRCRYIAFSDTLGTVRTVACGTDSRLTGQLFFEQGLMNRSLIDLLIGVAGETPPGLTNLILLFGPEHPVGMVL